MFNANHYRAKADESTESLKHTDDPNEIRELQRSKKSFTALAQNEDWLANNFDNIIHSQDIPPHNDDKAGAPVAGTTVAETEEHILRCEAPARALRYRWLNGRRAEIGRTESTDRPLSASPQG